MSSASSLRSRRGSALHRPLTDSERRAVAGSGASYAAAGVDASSAAAQLGFTNLGYTNWNANDSIQFIDQNGGTGTYWAWVDYTTQTTGFYDQTYQS